MNISQLNRLSLPLGMANEYVILAIAAPTEEDREHYIRKLRGRLQDVAVHAGYELKPVRTKDEEAA
jgi:hypothetical protein